MDRSIFYGARGMNQSPSWTQPFKADSLFVLDGTVKEVSGSYYLKDKTSNGRDFLITGIDWLTDTKVSGLLPFKTMATISAPAGDATLIAADINNFLYDSGGTPNQITPQMLFQNVDYSNKLFCRHIDHELNADNTEKVYSGIKDIILYGNAKVGDDLTTCNTYFGVPTRTAGALWVAKTGNDLTGNGSEATPYATIEKAVTVVNTTKTIYIKSGDYNVATSGFDYLRLSANAYAITFFGLGMTKLTSNNATQVILGTNAANHTFIRLYIYGTKTSPFNAPFTDKIYTMKYCEVNATATNNAVVYQARLEKCKIYGYWNCTTLDGVSTLTDCVLNGKAIKATNNDVVGRKTSITYCKGINSTANSIYEIIGGYFDYLYNTTYLTSSGNEVYVAYATTTKGTAIVNYNYSNITSASDVTVITQNASVIFSNITFNHNIISHVSASKYCIYAYNIVANTFTCEYNVVNSTSNYGCGLLRVVPTTNVPCAISVKYNNIVTSSTVLGAIIDFTESSALSGGNLVFNGAEVMYNYIKGGLADYPAQTQNCHAILMRSGKNMICAYNYVKNCAIGIVNKNEDVANTAGGIYGNVLIDNRASIFLRCARDLKVYGNVMYQANNGDNAQIIQMTTQGTPCKNVIVTNNIVYKRYPSLSSVLFSIDTTSISQGNIIRDNIVYSPDTDPAYWMSDYVTNYTLAEAVTNGWADNITEVDPQITALKPYPLAPITGATDLGADYDDGIDISSAWPLAVVLKQQGANWQYGAYVQ